MTKTINIIGAGLAGCETAFQLAEKGYKVNVYESKTITKNEVQKSDNFAELVCSNTFRSKSILNAVGILKEEMKMFDSLIINSAYETEIPADDALAVDRNNFSKLVTDKILSHPNITVKYEEYSDLDTDDVLVIATGPLTTPKMQKSVTKLLGKQDFYYLDASSPIVNVNSLDISKMYYGSRHGEDNSYLCIPLTEEQFNNFHNELINAKIAELKDVDKNIFFKGCQPIEQMAIESKKVLLNGPMSPNGLEDKDGNLPFAVIQLRRDDAIETLYNMVGFQTNITWPEQKRILKTLPGMENVEIFRYGVMHKNNYINSPKALNKRLQVNYKNNIFFAGQITGVEGYIESAASGIVAAYGVMGYLNGVKTPAWPIDSVLGSLINYITNPKHKNIKPMKANIGLLPTAGSDFETKDQKNEYLYNNAIKKTKSFKNNLINIVK